MRIVFITHNDLGLSCLEGLADLGADIKAIYTRPKKEDNADQTDLESFADDNSDALHRVQSVNTDRVKEQLRAYNPDLLFVIGWSRLVDKDVLNIPSVAALGMHPAPLPRGRGRAPIAWSLIKGLDKTSLSFFHLVEEADAGDLVGQEPIQITPEDDATSLYNKVVDTGEDLIRQYYPEFEAGHIPRQSQDDSVATWWPKREPHHGLIDWTQSPEQVYNWIRGQTRPYPGAFSYLDNEKVTVWKANPPDDERAFVNPGEIMYCDGGVLGVGAWEGIVELTEVQVDDSPIPAGKLVTEFEYEIGDVFENPRDRLK